MPITSVFVFVVGWRDRQMLQVQVNSNTLLPEDGLQQTNGLRNYDKAMYRLLIE